MERQHNNPDFEQNIIRDFLGHWIWIGVLSNKGYGTFKSKQAHRLVYEREVGPIPEGLVLDHLCRVHCCVNPAHLEPVTNQENVERGLWPGKAPSMQTYSGSKAKHLLRLQRAAQKREAARQSAQAALISGRNAAWAKEEKQIEDELRQANHLLGRHLRP